MPTGRLIPSSPEFAELWLRWRSEPASVRHNPLSDSSVEELRARLARASSDLSDLRAAEEFSFFWEVAGQPVGQLKLSGVSHAMGYAEIGYSITETHQGQGIGTQAVRAFVEKIFRETSLRRLFAYVAVDNTASCRLLEKVGFRREGVCREHFVIRGIPTDEAIYGILRTDLTPKSSYA